MRKYGIVSAAAFALLLAGSATLWAKDLPRDERVLRGELANGVQWLYRQHDQPPGKMALMIHIASGSLNETDAQRGLAHFLEHMAFNGSENFPPGTLIPYFESIGMEFGADLNAFTSFDQTAYMLFLPDTTVEGVEKGLVMLSDQAFRLLLQDDEIDKERGVILSEKRAGMSAQQRLRDELFEKLFAGTRLGVRLPIGTEEVIRSAPRSEFEHYYRTWYRPENVTVMLVGDAAPDAYLPLVEKQFGQYRSPLSAQKSESAGLRPFAEERAIVLSDPEYSTGDIDVYAIRPGRGATTTVAQFRVDLVERLGNWMIGRRYSEQVRAGKASYRSASAASFNFMNDAQLVNASASGEPADWAKMLTELLVEVKRGNDHGFTARELDLARRELISSAERAVRTESTRNARAFIMQMNSAVNTGETLTSAVQDLELLQEQLPGITLDEINAAFRENFAAGAFAYVLTMPRRDDVSLPSEDEVLRVARAALAQATEPPAQGNEAADLLSAEPTPADVVESETDADLGITSAWLSNGVRVHHRYMDYKKDSVWVSISLAGGQIEETPDNIGVSAVASLVLDQPATSRLSSNEIEDLLTGKNIRVGGGADDDTFTITVSGSPRDLEAGLRLAYALLTDGQLEESAFTHWKQGTLQRYTMAVRQPQYVGLENFFELLSGDDPRRMLLMSPELVEKQSVAAAQAWYDGLTKKAPIEVAVVGEMSLDDVLPLIAKYVGGLPARPRHAENLDALRKTARGAGPYERTVTVETVTPQAFVAAGFLGTDIQNIRDVRALNLAALTLDSQLIKRIREELGLVYSIGAQSSPAAAYPGSGFFLSAAPCAPGKGPEVVAEVNKLLMAYAENGPTAEELDAAKKQIKNNLDDQLKEPSFWFSQLQDFDLRGRKLADLKGIAESYEAFTADDVRDAFRKYCTPERLIHVIAVPAAADATEHKSAE